MRIPQTKEYSSRCLISKRPEFRTGEPVFYRCEKCGRVTPVNLDDPDNEVIIKCCSQNQKKLELCESEELCQEHKLDFTVFGGFEKSAVHLEVASGYHPMQKDHRIEWAYLRTFQGGQLKYFPNRLGRSVINFSVADDDAYVYCDRPICRMGHEHCQFECKRGMIAYAYCSQHGLFKVMLRGKD